MYTGALKNLDPTFIRIPMNAKNDTFKYNEHVINNYREHGNHKV